MTAAALPPRPELLLALAAFVAWVAFQRLVELGVSSRNARLLARQGGTQVREPGFARFVLLHALWPVALTAEVLWLGARPASHAALWLALFAGAQALRLAAMRALGVRWNVRIWILPGARPVTRGPYRALRHPNYLAVVIELLAGPLIFGAWRTAALASLVNASILPGRIRIEERALEQASAAPPADRGGAGGSGSARRDAWGGSEI